MPSISISAVAHRHDSTILPIVTIDDYFPNLPYIKLANWQYYEAPTSGGGDSFPIFPNNRSMIGCPVGLRICQYSGFLWDRDDEVPDSIGPTFTKASGEPEGYHGASTFDPLIGEIVSVQAKLTSTQLTSGMSLQNSTTTVTHNYFSADATHAMLFGQNGQLGIIEQGVVPKTLISSFKYEVGDIAMIERDENNIVRYYLIKPDKSMILLRTTRSKLTSDPVAELMLYFPLSSLESVFITDNDRTQTTFENIGVATHRENNATWQKWNNARTRISTADPIQLADGESEHTFPTSKRTLRQIALTPKTYTQKGFQIMEDFFNWHGNETEFLFVDFARKNGDLTKQEFWARFFGGISDTTGNGCLFDQNVQVVEAYRGDFIAQQIDIYAPVVELSVIGSSFSGTVNFVAEGTDAVAVIKLQLFIDGVLYAEEIIDNPTMEAASTFEVDTTDFANGSHTLQAKGIDFQGNIGVSAIETVTFTN